jgi:phosphoribosylglycinamide formyltransferase-1
MKSDASIPVPIAVFASGGGTNLQALLDHEQTSGFYKVMTVLSDRKEAGALHKAKMANRDILVISNQERSQDEIGEEIIRHLNSWDIQVITLAGYLRLMPSIVVHAYPKRILNIHPALLPDFGGEGMYGDRVHQAVLDGGVKVTGATVHYVDEEYDTGAILAQWPVPVLPEDDAKAISARVLKIEHLLYPAVTDHVCKAVKEGIEPEPFIIPSVDLESISDDEA